MLDILKSIKPVVRELKYIEINDGEILKLCRNLGKRDLQYPDVSLNAYQWKIIDLIKLTYLFSTMNFCYWAEKDEKKWTIRVRGKEQDGSYAMFQALEEELRKNRRFSSASYLKRITRSKLAKILDGNIEIPLFGERLSCIKEFGYVLEKKFKGTIEKLYEAGSCDAYELARILVENFPSYDDSVNYKKHLVAFYKRAQCNSKMLHDLLYSNDKKGLKNLDKLTAVADYKLPQILRKFKIFKYNKSLSRKIDSYTIISKGSREEIEIRSATIDAVERIKKVLTGKYKFVTASHIDTLLWVKSQKKAKEDKPYHRTYTIYY